jgi:hypothetical protein
MDMVGRQFLRDAVGIGGEEVRERVAGEDERHRAEHRGP